MTALAPRLLVCIALLALGRSAPPATHRHGGAGEPGAVMPVLFDTLGSHHRAITTTSPTAQAYFVTEVLAGALAARGGEVDTAVKHLAEAVRMPDEHRFTEPPPWYSPVRHFLGAVLMQVGRAPEAEAGYREDLRRNPENGWSLFGLAPSLRAQGKTADATAVDERFRRAWARADVALTASRF